MPKTDPIVEEAKKTLHSCDVIVDLYDLSYHWASEKFLSALGYTFRELHSKHVFDIIYSKLDLMHLRAKLISQIGKGDGELEYNVKTKSGDKLHLVGRFHVFTYDGVWYISSQVEELKAID